MSRTGFTDAELIDALELFIRNTPLTIWNGVGEFPGRRNGFGLSTVKGNRTLREALAVLVEAHRQGAEGR